MTKIDKEAKIKKAIVEKNRDASEGNNLITFKNL